MSYRSKRARLAQDSKIKDTTVQSVNDTIAQVIHDIGTGDLHAPETLLGSSCNLSTTTDQPTTTQVQGTTTEADDDLSNQRNAARRLPLTPSPSQPLTNDTCRQLRASRRRSLQVQELTPVAGEEEAHTLETQVSSCYNNWTDDPACTKPIQDNTMDANDAGHHQRNTGGRQRLTPPPSQPLPLDSPRQLRALNREPLCAQDDDGEPVQPEFSQVRPSKRSNWGDDIEFDETEEVEMRDLEGKRGKKGGRILPRHVWSLQPGVRFVVPFNTLDQPVKKGGHVLVKFLGDVARTGELCPIGEVNWHKVDKSYKVNIIALVREKFVLPNREEIDKAILKHVGKTWRSYRHGLKVQYKKPDKTQEQVASVVPKGVVPSQWIKLVQYWFSDKSEFLSTKGREARAALSHIHTSGSKSFAQKRDEFEKAHGREPGAIEWFVQTHRRKDGTYVETTSKEFLDAAATMIAQRAPSSSSKSVAVENQVFNELMYSDDERQRPIGYGFGVTRNKVFGLGAELRKKGYLASGTAEPMSISRNKTTGIGREPRRSGSKSLDTSAQTERLKFAVAATSEANELMQSQLQMQSQQLQMHSQQLQMQSQQMEGLRVQLQQVTSLLTKFGVMLNNPTSTNSFPATAPRRVPYQGVSFTNSQVPEASCESSDADSESSEWESD